MNGSLSLQELKFKKAMGIMAVIFFVSTLLFAIIPEELVRVNNFFGGILSLEKAPVPKEIPVQSVWPVLYEGKSAPANHDPLVADRGYLGMACGMAFLLAVICLQIFLDPRRYMNWVPIVLLGLASTSLFGLLFFCLSAGYLSNLIYPLFNLVLFAVIFFFYFRAKKAMGQQGEVNAE